MKEMMSIAMQIADAMQFLHMANVVHRDLKPSNCLVCVSESVCQCLFLPFRFYPYVLSCPSVH